MNEVDRRKAITRLAHDLTLHGANLQLVNESDQYPWFIQEMQRLFLAEDRRNRLLLPNIRDKNESVGVYSDYGGESSDSRFLTYSFLVCAWNQTGQFQEAMSEIRKKHKLDDQFKEIAFKDFRYGPIQRALDEYLSCASNFVNGLLLTIIIDKDIGSVWGSDRAESKKRINQAIAEADLGQWKPDIAEKMLRIVHFSSYLVALLSAPGQKVCWTSDHDAIADPPERFEKVLGLFDRLLKHYAPHDFEYVGGALPFDEKWPLQLDLLSLTDIVAGSIEHYYTRRVRNEGGEPTIKEQADKVLQWLTGDGIALKRRTMIFRAAGEKVKCGNVVFTMKEQDPNAIFVPVHVGQ